MSEQNNRSWLLLIHQIPRKPDYFRVKIWRRLQKVGAVALKQSVYVLPDNGQAYEDFLWIVKEITEGGGTASLTRTFFLEGLSDTRVKALFQTARNDDYEKLTEEVRELLEEELQLPDIADTVALKTRKELARLQRRCDEIAAIDFFQAPGRDIAEKALAECNSQLQTAKSFPESKSSLPDDVLGQTWVTRRGIHIDRIGCVWLIQRFIDRQAEFKFVADEKYNPKVNELRFDMFEAEYTHLGDKCTFEVLIDIFDLGSRPVKAIAEIIHDIDLKDNKYGRPESAGIQALFTGLLTTCEDDAKRLVRGEAILDELFTYFSR